MLSYDYTNLSLQLNRFFPERSTQITTAEKHKQDFLKATKTHTIRTIALACIALIAFLFATYYASSSQKTATFQKIAIAAPFLYGYLGKPKGDLASLNQAITNAKQQFEKGKEGAPRQIDQILCSDYNQIKLDITKAALSQIPRMSEFRKNLEPMYNHEYFLSDNTLQDQLMNYIRDYKHDFFNAIASDEKIPASLRGCIKDLSFLTKEKLIEPSIIQNGFVA